jgi:tetratricopeptide (TPR) repeat protein
VSKAIPDDITAQNKLGGYYLQTLRETGNLTYLELATRAAQASLKAVPAEVNRGGLSLLAQTEFAGHNFAAARDYAQQLVQLDGGKAYPYQLLGDAQLELGEYDACHDTIKKLAQLAPNDMATETRLARLAACAVIMRARADITRTRYKWHSPPCRPHAKRRVVPLAIGRYGLQCGRLRSG